MDERGLSRRRFLQTSAAMTGAAVLAASPAWSASPKRTATDQVTLGKTGITLSRLGFGTGSHNGAAQTQIGKEGFVKLIRYAYDSGITYIDSASQYATFDWIADAIKDLPREKLFLQSKVRGKPDDVLAEIDRHRSTFKTDYIDSLLVHCMVQPDWTDAFKKVMDGFDAAKEKKWIRAKGVSCHTLNALQAATNEDWCQVNLVRVNPVGRTMDVAFNGPRGDADPNPVLKEIKSMHERGRGVIGMKIMGNGTFTDPAEREKSVRFAMNNPNIDAVVIGMKSRQEIDENIKLINLALAAA